MLNLHYLQSTLPAERRPLVDLAGRAAWAFLADHAEESGPLFEQLVARFPNEPGVHYLDGVFLMDHDTRGAEQEFRKEVRITPSHVLARVQLSQLLGKDGEMAAAVQLAQEAARLEPSDALCLATLGRALLDAGRTGEAIAALEKAERLAPEAARTHFYLMRAYGRAGRNGDAAREKTEWERLHAAQKPSEVLVKPEA